jgi:hypothetical protein
MTGEIGRMSSAHFINATFPRRDKTQCCRGLAKALGNFG